MIVIYYSLPSVVIRFLLEFLCQFCEKYSNWFALAIFWTGIILTCSYIYIVFSSVSVDK